jgi:hypothetical protein
MNTYQEILAVIFVTIAFGSIFVAFDSWLFGMSLDIRFARLAHETTEVGWEAAFLGCGILIVAISYVTDKLGLGGNSF